MPVFAEPGKGSSTPINHISVSVQGQQTPKTRENHSMKELLVIIAIVGVYLLMQLVILPKMGIST